MQSVPSSAGVQMAAIPPDAYLPRYDIQEEPDPDERLKTYARNHLILKDTEAALPLYGSGRSKLPA